jgi:hypothetical protein
MIFETQETFLFLVIFLTLPLGEFYPNKLGLLPDLYA